MPRPTQVLQIEPSDALRFRGPFTDVVTAELTLRNPTNQQIAFKVKTTAPRRYCVRPNSGTLNEDESMTVSVMLQPFDYDPSERTKHKFMIQSTVVPPGIVEPDTIWRDANPDELMDTKLRVVFDNERDSKTSNEETSEAQTASTSVSKASNVSEEEFQKVREENDRLSAEIVILKEEGQRLRKIAMNDTVSSGAPTFKATPSGIRLLFQEKKNIIILLILFIAAFFSGMYLSDSIMVLKKPANN